MKTEREIYPITNITQKCSYSDLSPWALDHEWESETSSSSSRNDGILAKN